jgi:glutaconate CoA-transferase subunit A
MRDKRIGLAEAVSLIPNGAVVALGGNSIQRAPIAAVHEMVRQGKRGLEIVKTAGAYDIDLLAGTSAAASVSAGFVGFETLFGLAPSYRRAVEHGLVEAKEHACYTVIAGLRAAIQGVPFMPVAGMFGSDLIAARGFQTLDDPYTGEPVVVIPRLQPDVAIIHVQEADREGNAHIVGSQFEDVLMAKAAAKVIVTAERIVDGTEFEAAPEAVAIAGFLVDGVVEAPRGAWPCGCAGEYEPDLAFLAEYVAASKQPDTLDAFVNERILGAGVAA